MLLCLTFLPRLADATIANDDQLEQLEPEPAAQPAVPYPAGISMPWRLIQIDALDASKTFSALKPSADALARSWLTSPTALTSVASKGRVVSRNHRLISDQIWTGAAQGALPSAALTLEPSWCAVMDSYLFFVTASDTVKNQLLGSAHTAIERSVWGKMKPDARRTYLSEQLPGLGRQALSAAQGKSLVPADALHVGLSLGRAVTRDDQGSSACLTQLLEEELAKSFSVARTLGGDHLALTRRLLSQPAQLLKPTRTLLLDWTHPPEAAISPHLPITFTLRAQVLDAVFGKHLSPALTSQVACAKAAPASVQCRPDGVVKAWLTAQAEALKLSDWPQVAKINRAWVYLDRGRAWGLKMNDRVVATIGGQLVKGHVVQFFGPEQKLTSPRGFPINEGAIVYLRLNQRLAAKGLEFKMDPRTFPTPYPLPPLANASNAKP